MTEPAISAESYPLAFLRRRGSVRCLVSATLITLAILVCAHTNAAEPPEVQWTLKATHSANPNNASTFVRSIVADYEGNSFFFGPIRAKVTLNGQSVSEETEGLPNVLAKLSPAGRVIWLKRLGFGPILSSLAVTSKGEILFFGDFIEMADLGGQKIPVGPNGSLVLAKFDSNGELLWHKKIDSQPGCSLFACSMTAGPTGAIFISGVFSGKFSIGSNSFTNSSGRADAFVASLSSDGEVGWAKSIVGPEKKHIYSMAADSAGGVFLGGSFESEMVVGKHQLHSLGKLDGFVAKCGSQGDFEWAMSFGSHRNDEIRAVAADSFDNCSVAGVFADAVEIGGFRLVSNGEQDILLAALNSAGKLNWVRAYGSPFYDGASDIAVEHDGQIYMSGYCGSPLPSLNITNASGFVAGLDKDGSFKWSKPIYSDIEPHLPISIDGHRNVFAIGGLDRVRTNRMSSISFVTKFGLPERRPNQSSTN